MCFADLETPLITCSSAFSSSMLPRTEVLIPPHKRRSRLLPACYLWHCHSQVQSNLASLLGGVISSFPFLFLFPLSVNCCPSRLRNETTAPLDRKHFPRRVRCASVYRRTHAIRVTTRLRVPVCRHVVHSGGDMRLM